MQYAIINGVTVNATPHTVAECQFCGTDMIAKCGDRVVWHWAHRGHRRCDPWWENETDWHRKWKGFFPEAWRERVFFSSDGEKHIADIRTEGGLTIEFQHSSIAPVELRIRNTFYDRVVWIVDGLPFENRFHVLSKLPPPDSDEAKRLIISLPHRYPKTKKQARRRWQLQPTMYWPEHVKELGDGVTMYDDIMIAARDSGYESYNNPRSVFEHINAMATQYRFLDWHNPRTAWLVAGKPVLVDCHPKFLFRLVTVCGQSAVEVVKKAEFLSRARQGDLFEDWFA